MTDAFKAVALLSAAALISLGFILHIHYINMSIINDIDTNKYPTIFRLTCEQSLEEKVKIYL